MSLAPRESVEHSALENCLWNQTMLGSNSDSNIYQLCDLWKNDYFLEHQFAHLQNMNENCTQKRLLKCSNEITKVKCLMQCLKHGNIQQMGTTFVFNNTWFCTHSKPKNKLKRSSMLLAQNLGWGQSSFQFLYLIMYMEPLIPTWVPLELIPHREKSNGINILHWLFVYSCVYKEKAE